MNNIHLGKYVLETTSFESELWEDVANAPTNPFFQAQLVRIIQLADLDVHAAVTKGDIGAAREAHGYMLACQELEHLLRRGIADSIVDDDGR